MNTGLRFRTISSRQSLMACVRGVMVCGLFSLIASGCVAQQADLARIQKDLEQQIAKIKEEKKALGAEVEEARSAINESQSLLAQQKAEMAQMHKILTKRSDFADLHQKVTLIREQDLRVLYGKNEEVEKKISDLENSLQAQTGSIQSELDSLHSTVQAQDQKLQTQSEQIQSAQVIATALAQQVDENNQALTANMTDFQHSLAQFKETLTGLGTTIGDVRTDLTAQYQKGLSAQRQELERLQSHTDELAQSTLQVREALEKSGTVLDSRLEKQATHLAQLQGEVAALRDKLNTDTQALQSYLEKDVKGSMAQMVTDSDRRLENLQARLDALQKDMEVLGTHAQEDAASVQDLRQTVVQLREAQEVMGSLLGKRGDEIIQQAGRLTERMNVMEAHQSDLTEQLQSNTQKTSAHLAEVNDSLTTVSQALDHTGKTLSTRLAKQEEAVRTLNDTRQQFQQLKLQTQDQIQQMQAAGQLTDQLRQTVEEVSSRLHKLEIHQSGLVGKLDSDAQMTNTHLQEVNQGLQSLAQALENVSSKLNTRIEDQEKRLNRAMTSFQSVEGTAEISQTNVTHLNQLTETVNRLRDIVNTIGTKLGERVDQHEDRLGQLAQRVNQLQNTKAQK